MKINEKRQKKPPFSALIGPFLAPKTPLQEAGARTLRTLPRIQSIVALRGLIFGQKQGR
jgi:hypothetical protein